ncbi:MAG: tetratricopeptide repeat protein, partial [Candidatus Brocadiae bacterium]|nr:tetratricopeptide repeat protein [Candidatus Brocadiia bacterium]
DLRRVLSSLLRKAGRLDDALEQLHLALAAYRLAGDRQRAAITRAAHARIILDQGNPGRALSELTEALAIQREVPFTQFTSQTLSDISLARMALGHYDDADAAIREAIELSRGTDQVSLRIAHLRQRASIAGKRGDYAFASAALAEAIDLARTSGNPRVLPSLLNNLANTQVRSGHWENALRSYEEAVSCARDGGDPGPLSVFLSNVGTVSMRLGDTARARRSMEEARSLLDDRSAKARIADLLHMEAQIDLLEGALVPAGRRLRESLAAARSAGDRRATGQVLTELAELRRVEGDLRGAEEAAAEAAQILLAIGEGSAGGPVSVRACVALAEGRMKDASRLADAALEVSARTAADSDDATAARLCVARAALALGDPARARAAVLPPLASLRRRSDAHFLAIVELLLSRAERLLGNRDAADALLAGGLRGMDDGRTPFLVRMDCAREGIEGLCEAGRRGEAEALLERAALEAEAAGALGLAGELEDALGRHEKASE